MHEAIVASDKVAEYASQIDAVNRRLYLAMEDDEALLRHGIYVALDEMTWEAYS
jgi:hypothetical protein